MEQHDSLRDDFARMLRASREARGWSRAKLARQLGSTEATVWHWEKAASAPGFDAFLFLCVVFNWPHVMLDDSPPIAV